MDLYNEHIGGEETQTIKTVKKIGKWGEYTLLILAIGLMIFGIIRWFGRDIDMSPVKRAEETSQQIKKEVDSIKIIQKYLVERSFQQEAIVTQLQTSIDNTNRKIDIANSRLIKIQNLYNGKISRIDNYTRTQLDSLFADYIRKYSNQ